MCIDTAHAKAAAAAQGAKGATRWTRDCLPRKSGASTAIRSDDGSPPVGHGRCHVWVDCPHVGDCRQLLRREGARGHQ